MSAIDHPRVRLLLRLLVAASALLAVVGGLAPPAGAADAPAVRRVLVFSLPFVSWEDLDLYDAPNLERFLDHAAIAGLTTRADKRETKLADGYLTLGAGTRAVGDPSTDGDALGVNEPFGRDIAGDVYFQRTGRTVSRGIVSLAMPRVVAVNESLLYDADLGALAIALRDAGVDRAAIANADGRQPDSPPSPQTSTYRRQAALALVDARGRLPAGTVDRRLLARDTKAPYGLSMDRDGAVRAFDRAFVDRSVVLVEASDLVRADAYRAYVSPVRKEVMTGQAIHRSDRLFGRLLERVDPRRDAVLVVGPAHSSRGVTLTVLGVRAPGMGTGLLRSATTRRSGFVQLIDVAPTILDLLHIDRPSGMEGRPVEVGRDGGSAADRRELLVHSDEAAQFRDLRVGEIQTAAVVFAAALALGTFLLFRAPRPASWRDWLGTVALCVLGFLPATFLVRAVPVHTWGFVPYWALVVAVSIALGAGYRRIGRMRWLDALLAALLLPIALLIIDVLVGTPLQFNSALGYSPTVAGRFTGFSNPAYAIVAASSVIAAPLLAHRIGGRRGAWVGIGLFAVVVVVDGAPFWGSDVGGILSMVPAFLVTTVLLLGWRVRWRTVGWCVVGLVVVLGIATALDLSRAPERRTHLGRLVERIEDRGIGDFVVVVQRKLGDNLGSLRSSVWGFMLPIALALALWLVLHAGFRLRALVDAIPEVRIAGTGLAIVAILGWVLNDSGIAIPGVMLVIAIASLVWLLVRTDPDRLAEPSGPVPERTALWRSEARADMTVVLGLVVGALAVQLLRVGASGMLRSPVLMRQNYRGHVLPTGGGILIVLAVLFVEAGRAGLGALGVGESTDLTIERSEVLFAVVAFGLLGLIDDLLGDGRTRGFRGHVRALLHGEITTGFLKLSGGAAVAVVLVATPGFATGRRILVDAVLIALAANLGNLLDRAPGRTLKAAAIAYVPLAILLGDGAVGVAIAPAMGAAFGLMPEDMRERLMLGDAGANVVGAILGLGVVLGRGEVTRITALVVLVVANVAAEIVSFSDIIDRVRPLRWLDRLGQLPERRDFEQRERS